MKKWFVTFGLIIWSLQTAPVSAWAEDGWTGNVNATFGYRDIQDTEYDDFSGPELGLDIDFRNRAWPVNIVLGVKFSSLDDDFLFGDEELDITEFQLGVRKIFEPTPKTRPYIGGGLAVVHIGYDYDSRFTWGSSEYGRKVTDDDNGFGAWINVGMYWTLFSHVNLGVDLGYSYALVTVLQENINAGGLRGGLLLGYHW